MDGDLRAFLAEMQRREVNKDAKTTSTLGRGVVGAPTRFALERLRDAKRFHEKTKTGRARDASQELHHAERAGAP